jgi:triosephosphate isomerase (TIM)
MTDRMPLIVGNWKMNLNHFEAIALVQKLAFALNDGDFDIRSVQTLVEGDKYDIAYGAQDLSPNESGAYTGDVSGSMLAKLGCSYVTVGHSERRQIHQESDEIVNAKARTALRYEITPIICVGEGREVREARGHVAYVLAQLAACLEGLTAEQVAGAVIAYEPVWAIGTGMVATPDDAQEVCAAIRTRVGELLGAGTARAVRVLYGGSVKANNIAGIMAQPDIDGALVGGASLDPDEFVGIVRFRLHPAETGG